MSGSGKIVLLLLYLDVMENNMDGEFKKVNGTPTMMMLPARNYTFKIYEDDYSIIIPRKGMYKDLDGMFFDEDDGGFDILSRVEEEKGEVLFVPSLSKVLFATAKYPKLENDQAFVPIAIIFREDEVEIVGNIIQMIKEN